VGLEPNSYSAPSPKASTSSKQLVALSALAPGESGIIESILGTPVTKLHLMEMGLTPGTSVEVLRIGAFGGPIDLLVRGYRLSLRQTEAGAINLKT
jgi:ferrous iron transport protein A